MDEHIYEADHSAGLIYQLTHTYSRLSDYYAVRMEWCSSDVNYACAYIQLVRDEFPSLPFLDDCIGEYEAFHLLQKFYGAQPERDDFGTDDIIDLHENWETYVCAYNLHKINAFAVPNARYMMLEFLCAEAEQFVAEHGQSRDKYLVDIERLKSLLTGEKVLDNWGWQNIAGKSLTGFGVSRIESPELLNKRY